LSRIEVGEKGESVAVKLGNPDGEDLPLQVSSAPDQVMQAVLSAREAAAATTVEETRSSAPDPEPSAQAVPVAPAKPQRPTAKPAPAVTRPPTEAARPAPSPSVTEKVIRGSEKGNSSELILKPQGDKIGQTLASPPFLYMPLPARLDPALLNRIGADKLYSADERRALLLQFYDKGEGSLTLTQDPGISLRPALWAILEAAGYDLANADYKKGRELRPVVITFRLGVPGGSGSNPELSGVQVAQSSGNPAVDEAVVYAFRQAVFANGTGQVAQGRYTYDFGTKR